MTRPKTTFRKGLLAKLHALPVMTLVCLGLLALLSIVQVTHLHPLASDADHCQLCIAMHTAAPSAITTAAVVLVPVGASVPVAETRPIARRRPSKLFTRPPPAEF